MKLLTLKKEENNGINNNFEKKPETINLFLKKFRF